MLDGSLFYTAWLASRPAPMIAQGRDYNGPSRNRTGQETGLDLQAGWRLSVLLNGAGGFDVHRTTPDCWVCDNRVLWPRGTHWAGSGSYTAAVLV